MLTRFWKKGSVVVVALFGTALCAFAATPARPGTINYVEGGASINGEPLAKKDVGTKELETGQVLQTDGGKVEVLLTPGVFLRVGSDSEVRMVSAGLANTQVEILKGRAMVEAAQLYKENNLQILDQASTTSILKEGLYRFDADTPRISVFDGKAKVFMGDRSVELGKGKEVVLTSALKAEKFDRKASDELISWSNLRSQYLADASGETVRGLGTSGYGFSGSGWYWNPYFGGYSYLPGAGPLYSPFGWGFSPWGYGPSYYNRPYYYRRPVIIRPPIRPGRPPMTVRPGSPMRPGGSGPRPGTSMRPR